MNEKELNEIRLRIETALQAIHSLPTAEIAGLDAQLTEISAACRHLLEVLDPE